ncbi:SWIM zinc finger domain-containing protein [Paenibacillus yanchengensis]|uniref:SWIM zinc finger domain-containing protein n=1 Tax=Paenibacillus yanchengensis TaxID=2035833 RepID=A0ABW4YR33_9BACL
MLPFTELQISELERSLRQDCTEQIIKRGWNYYNDHHVKKIEISDHRTILGHVAGSEVYAVTIDAEEFHYSHCSCPYEQCCKHIVAVFFQLLQQNMRFSKEEIEQCYFRLLGLKPARQLVSANDELADNGNYTEAQAEQWVSFLQKKYGESWRGCRHSLHPIQSVLTNIKAVARDWNVQVQKLYWCYAIIFVLKQSERAVASIDAFSRYYYETTFLRMSEPWLAQFHDLLEQFIADAGDEYEQNTALKNWSQLVVAELRNSALHKDRQLIEWDYMYIAALRTLGKSSYLLQQEQDKVTALIDHPSRAIWNEDYIQMAAGYITFEQGKYEVALQYMHDANFDRVQKLIYDCVQQLTNKRELQQVMDWLHFIYTQLQSSTGKRTVGPFIRLCLAAETAFPDAMHFEKYMLGLLPHSYLELSEYLIATERYKAWAELQLYTGVKLEEVNMEQVRKVAASDPQQMLPLYHQSIDASISSRTRQGYRMAAKQLKALEKLYQQQAKTDSFQRYIYFIADKHKRLRAFQEELWKGNLIK